MLKPFGRTAIAALIFILVPQLFVSTTKAATEEGSVTVTIPAGVYEFEEEGNSLRLMMEGFGRLPDVGKPFLPSKIFSIAIPPGAVVTDLTFHAEKETFLSGEYTMAPVPLPRVLGEENPALYQRDLAQYEANHDAVYSSSEPYPAAMGEFVSQAFYRRYNVAEVRVSPFTWLPHTKRLIFRPEIEVCVHYAFPQGKNSTHAVNDYMTRTEQRAQKHIMNYGQAQAWYPKASFRTGLHDYVIITLNSLTAAVEPLVLWETGKGRTVEVVTTDWIDTHYSGYDLAEKMRNFLRDKYPSGEWGIEDLCLVGHYDDVPMRRCWQDLGYGKPETDFYYAELSLPDSQSWDKDQDHQWGENTDPMDFYAEINVGRIPWSDAATVAHICQKSVAYENNTDPAFKKNMLLLGAFFWADTDNAEIMEYKSDPAHCPWMSGWTTTRLYEQGYSVYPSDGDLKWANVRNLWQSGKYAFVNYAGHGSPTASAIMYSTHEEYVSNQTCNYLNDDYPSIVFADACSNSDTDFLNIGQALLKRGAVGFVGATKVANGVNAWNDPSDGSSQSLDYFFTSNVTSCNFTQGQAHHEALRKMYVDGLWWYNRYETFEWSSLWGQPALSMGTAPALVMGLSAGLDKSLRPPGEETPVQVEIRDALESYVPGTGRMHYRMNADDSYTAVDLVPLGNDLFEAMLPATSPGDHPEFYFSAQSDGGGTVHLPTVAPYDVFSFEVCIMECLMRDDFETDTGWTIDDHTVTAGGWERGDPEGTEAQPEDDYSPDGNLCYVTGAAGGAISDNDLDGGPSRLFSPKFDLSGSDAIIRFRVYFYHTAQGVQFPLLVHVGTSDITWYTVAELEHNPEWTLFSFRVSDYCTPNSTVQVRFTVKDKP
ncbi:MAG: C25 family cysteine peptidase, partial [Planctomycetota bacterium]